MNKFAEEVLKEATKDENGNYDDYEIKYLVFSKLFIEKEREKYEQAVGSYESIVRKTASFFKEENIKDSIDTFNIFNYLLWNGIFSINNEYKYSISLSKSLTGYLGMNIMTGRGVCRNNADFLSKIIKDMGMYSMFVPVLCKIKKLDYKPDIERKIEKPTLLVKAFCIMAYPLQTTFLNHALVVAEKDGHYYALDPTNLCIFKLDDYFIWSAMNGTGNVKSRELLFGLFDKTNEDELITVINACESENIPYLTDDYTKEKSEEMLDYCRRNNALFNDFHSYIRGDIEIVNNALVKRRPK